MTYYIIVPLIQWLKQLGLKAQEGTLIIRLKLPKVSHFVHLIIIFGKADIRYCISISDQTKKMKPSAPLHRQKYILRPVPLVVESSNVLRLRESAKGVFK
jgi:hypothetical protein